jgi:Ser/Thr protein kinase RdoA (MazF antagonist)
LVTVEYSAEVLADLQVMVGNARRLWGLSSAAGVSLLNVSENATFAVSDACGRDDRERPPGDDLPDCGDAPGGRTVPRELVIRVHRVGYSSAVEIRSELEWINALRRERVVETATPVAGVDGEYVQTLESPSGRARRFAVAFERLPGREPDAGADAPRWFERLGEVTARMHRHSRAWALPEGFRRKRWDVESMVGDRGYWGPWRAALGLEAPGPWVIERALAVIRERLERFGTGAARFGLVHADLRLANLLVDGSHLRIIDFDDCGFGWFLYDFAAAVSFIEHEMVVGELLRAWVVGYRQVAPLSAAELEEMPSFVVLRRILLTAWLASHAEVPFARAMGAAYTAGTVRLARDYLDGRFLAECGAGV